MPVCTTNVGALGNVGAPLDVNDSVTSVVTPSNNGEHNGYCTSSLPGAKITRSTFWYTFGSGCVPGRDSPLLHVLNNGDSPGLNIHGYIGHIGILTITDFDNDIVATSSINSAYLDDKGKVIWSCLSAVNVAVVLTHFIEWIHIEYHHKCPSEPEDELVTSFKDTATSGNSSIEGGKDRGV